MKKAFLIAVFAFTLLLTTKSVKADCNQQCLTDQINQYTQKIAQLQGQANTLSNQIASFNAQIRLTELKVQQTEDQINLLSGRIDQLEVSLQDLNKAFSARAVATYKMARADEPVYILFSANDMGDAVSKFHYLQQIENYDQTLLGRLQSAQDIYKTNKQQSETLQKQLQTQEDQLNAQKASKARLLAETQGSEQTYQNLLAAAKAQLAQLANYAESVGVSLLPHQDISDGWGKYYNQRDSDWGAILMNGSTEDCRGGPCALSRVGCLATSYAMVSSHYGASITPKDVAINPSNFYLSTADFLNPGPSANGHSPTRLDNPSVQDLKDRLNSGAVIIAGMSVNGGPYPQHYSDHWVVLRSVDGDSFRINDPLYQGAMNVSLKDHYSSWTIIQATVYN